MRIIMKLMIVSLILLGRSFLGDVAFADEYESGPAVIDEISEFGEPVSRNTLDALSGGQSMQIDNIDMLMNNMNIKSNLAENILYSSTSTGANILSNDAFSNSSGISTVIQNSGNQVIINSALILNVQMQ